ncbi:MAG: hypothetical protein RSB45_03390 [Bacilli bacterium]
MGTYNKTISASGFSVLPDIKYYENYTSSTGIKGDATNADGTNGWYQDINGFVNSTSPWFGRGGGYSGTIYSGIFCFSYYQGNPRINGSTRFVAKP